MILTLYLVAYSYAATVTSGSQQTFPEPQGKLIFINLQIFRNEIRMTFDLKPMNSPATEKIKNID